MLKTITLPSTFFQKSWKLRVSFSGFCLKFVSFLVGGLIYGDFSIFLLVGLFHLVNFLGESERLFFYWVVECLAEDWEWDF